MQTPPSLTRSWPTHHLITIDRQFPDFDMTYQDFFSKYSYNRKTDKVSESRFGAIYKATATVTGQEVYLRVMHVTEGSDTITLKEEVEFTEAIGPYRFLADYAESHRFEEATGEIDCAVMPCYPLGNMVQLMEQWKLDDMERTSLRDNLLAAAAYLRGHEVNLPPFDPATVFVSEEDGQLIPHLTDLSGVMSDNPDYERQINEFLPLSESHVEDTTEENNARKWKLLGGVVLTWGAIIALICMVHINRNSEEDDKREAIGTDSVKQVIYPADRFAMEEAARNDSISKARADSTAAVKADSVALANKIEAKEKLKSKEPVPAPESEAPQTQQQVAAPAATETPSAGTEPQPTASEPTP